MKTIELNGAALDWAVARCEGYLDNPDSWMYQAKSTDLKRTTFHPSQHWAQGGPIIERECMTLNCGLIKSYAMTNVGYLVHEYGDTPLIAAMRCYVASKLGDEVEIPKELI